MTHRRGAYLLATPVADYFRALEGVEGAQGLMIGLDWDFISGGVEPHTLSLMKDAVATFVDLGALTRSVVFPNPDAMLVHSMSLMLAETAFAHVDTYPAKADRYGPWIRDGFETALATSPVEIARGNVLRHQFKGAVMSLFSEIDMLIVPVFSQGTPTWTEARHYIANDMPGLMRFTMPFNASGNPTVTLPCGYSVDGRPVAFQLVGAHGAEAMILKAAHAYQMVTDHHLRRPPGL
jgi:amidase